MSARFSRDLRLRKRRDFVAVQGAGRKVGGKHFLLIVARGPGRLGITVSKKVGNAVTRNRLKRFVREFVRRAEFGRARWLGGELDVVVIARPSASVLSFGEVASDLERLGARL